MSVLLFVTAEMPVESVNAYLSECQILRDLVCNSLYSLIRDRSVDIEDIDSPGTEPPVAHFQSGFIGASDDELWQVHEGFNTVEDERNHNVGFNKHHIVVLDERAERDETAKVLYKTDEGQRASWRVPYRFMPAVHADLFDCEETYLKPGMVDGDGVLNMRKIKLDLGGVWPYDWWKLK